LEAILSGAALVATACGSDDDTSSDTTPVTEAAADATDAPADTEPAGTEPAETEPDSSEPAGTEPVGTEAEADDPLGTPTPADGEPVKIGLLTESGGEAISSQSELTETGAQIAVDYVNEYRGGLAGQPIELVICGNKASASGAADCANQMIEEDVAAVVWPFTGFGPQQVPIITGAGIPIIAVSGSSTEELTTPGVFIITGGYVGTLGAYAQHSSDNAVEKFSMITIDVPSATQAAEGIGALVFGNAGVEYSVVKVAPGTPDMTAQVQAAISDGATALGVTGDVTFCTSFFQAYQALALDVPKYIIQPCVDPTVIESLSDVLDGSILATTVAVDDDTDLYAAMVGQYGDGDIDPNPSVSSGVSEGVATIMNLWNRWVGVSGPVTAAGAAEQAKTAGGTAVGRSGGLTFTCDGTAIPLLPNLCSAQFQIGTVDGAGEVSGLEPVDASALFTTG
jgi:branched-chain amino acid transport system substrate-binding protein